MTGYIKACIEIQLTTYMKLLLTALCASFMVVPAFASECEKGKCDKGKCDKEKKEEGTFAHCGKCEGDKDKDKDKDKEKKKDEGALLASECEKGKCDKEKKEEGALA
jgi:hypothetical protein